MAHRHKMHERKHGGKAPEAYDAKGSHVEEEAEEKQRGGRTRAEGGKVVGRASGGRLDKRKRGGKVGKDMTKSPFSEAHIKGAMNPAGNPAVHKG